MKLQFPCVYKARAGQGKAGRLPEKPRQLPVLPTPLSSWFFWKLMVMTVLSGKFGATGIKVTNFLPNGIATPARMTTIPPGKDEEHE